MASTTRVSVEEGMAMAVGLFMSRAARSDGPLDLEVLAGGARADVARVYDDFFSPEARADLLSTIKSSELDGVVLAGPSPHYYESTLSGRLFMEDVEDAGIDPNRISVANLHEQVQLAHASDPAGARAKAAAIVDVALARLDVSQPLETYEIAPRRSVMVLGAGVGGFVAAQRLLELGFKVVMVERQGTTRDVGKFALEIGPTVSYVLDHPRAKVFFGTEVEDLSGWCGDYKVVLGGQEGEHTLHVGGVIMAAGSDAEWIDKLRYFLRIDVDGEGLARSMDPRMLPVQTDDEGLAVLPPLAKSDEWLHDRIEQAESAVLSVAIKLNQFEIHHHADVTQVNADLCGGCASCVKTCAFGASSIDPGTNLSVVDIERCRGCGKCVVSCPVGARDLISSPNAYVADAIEILAEAEVAGGGPKVLAFLCRGCGYTAADNAGIAAGAGEDEGYPASVLPLRIPCGGRLDTQFVLQALRRGFDGVMVARCHEGQCHNLIGNLDMDRRMSLLREFLRAKSVDPERMRIMDVGPTEGREFASKVRDFVASLEAKGGGGGGR